MFAKTEVSAALKALTIGHYSQHSVEAIGMGLYVCINQFSHVVSLWAISYRHDDWRSIYFDAVLYDAH